MTTKAYVSLKTAAEDKEFAPVAKSVPTFNVDPRKITVVPGFNHRPVDPEHVQVLKTAWLAGKDATPPYNPLGGLTLRVVDGEFRLVDGEHRHTAYMELIAAGEPIERVPCEEFKGSDKDAILYSLAKNSGKGAEMPQLGAKYAELVNSYGMTFSEVAKARGRTAQHVKDCIALVEISNTAPVIKDAIKEGTIAPATALKLARSQGAKEAERIISKARSDISEGVKAPKGGKITQKVIDNLARSKVDEASVRGKQIKDHLSAMLESPSFGREVKDAIRKVMKAIGGRLPDAVTNTAEIDHVGEFLREISCNSNDLVKGAAKTLTDYRNKVFIPANNSPEAQYYGHMVWLQNMEADHKKPAMRMGAKWFITLLDANRSDKPVAAPPSILSLDQAIQTEIDSNGAANAESMCPEHAHLVQYLRGGVAQ